MKKTTTKKTVAKKTVVKKVSKATLKKQEGMVNAINKLASGEAKGFSFVATFKEDGKAVDFVESISEATVGQVVSLIAALIESADIEDQVIRLLLVSKMRG